MITRIFTGPDGLAHAEDIELKLNSRGVSEMLKATGAEFSVRAPTAGAKPGSTAATDPNDPGWHTGPARQFVITLSGSSEVEVSGGVHVVAGPGHINLIEDTTGKGHMTRNFGPEDRIALTIPLAEGVVIEGVRKPENTVTTRADCSPLSQCRFLHGDIEAQRACGFASAGDLAASDPEPAPAVAAAAYWNLRLRLAPMRGTSSSSMTRVSSAGIGSVGSRRSIQPRG